MQNQLNDFLSSHSYSSCFLLSDSTIFHLYGQEITSLIKQHNLPLIYFLVQEGEKAKTLTNAETCWHIMHEHGIDRSSLVLGLGGGAITDLAGFVASCFMRGIDSLYIPTTLLGMVDAAIGGKTAVNIASGKNIIGSFQLPKEIITDCKYLKNLPNKEMSSGLAEVIKTAVIGDPSLFIFLESNMPKALDRETNTLNHIIHAASSVKNKIVSQDFKETHQRVLLNYGHTFGHALEYLTDYKMFTHGEAISIGMQCAANTAAMMGMIKKDFIERQHNLCRKANLPTSMPKKIDTDQLVAIMQKDKKAVSGNISLILPLNIGHVKLLPNIPIEIIKKGIEKTKESL